MFSGKIDGFRGLFPKLYRLLWLPRPFRGNAEDREIHGICRRTIEISSKTFDLGQFCAIPGTPRAFDSRPITP
jgi:hypothetical protein